MVNKLQTKFIKMILLTSTVPLIIVAVLNLRLLEKISVKNANQNVSAKLEEVCVNYEIIKDNLKFIVRDQNRRIFSLVDDNQLDLLKNEYQKIVKQKKLDFLVVTDVGGKVLVSMSSPEMEGYNYSRNVFVQRAMRGKFEISTEIFDDKELKRLGLQEKSYIAGLEPQQGLVVIAYMPLINNNEIVVGTVLAGYLLNNNTNIILDKIIHGDNFDSSVFLNNIRVASSLTLKNSFVLGQGLDSRISEGVLTAKNKFVGRININKEWYMSGYSPIFNIEKKVVGILAVGIPERKIFALRDKTQFLFLLAVFVSIILALIVGLLIGEKIASSVKKLKLGIEAFARGKFDYHVKIKSDDEIEELGKFFNNTMAQLRKTKEALAQSNEKLTETQTQLLEYERMAALGRMASVVSHELRNIFAGINASTQFIKNNFSSDSEKTISSLRDIETNLNYANNVINTILRIHYPKKLIFSELDLQMLVDNILSTPTLSQMIKDNMIEIIRDYGENVFKIKADGLQLKEAISIIIVNALQAMPQGGKLTISVKNADKGVLLVISDTGHGMSKEIIDNLFTPFVTTKSRGLGLGLCISREIIKAHKASIEVESQINNGTSFKIFLPVEIV